MCNKSFSVLSNLRRHMKNCGSSSRRRGQAASPSTLRPLDASSDHSADIPSSCSSSLDSLPSVVHAHPYSNLYAATNSQSTHPLATASWPLTTPEPIGSGYSPSPNHVLVDQADFPPHWHSITTQIPRHGQPSGTSHSRNCPTILRDSLEVLLVNQDMHLGSSGPEYWVGEFDCPNPMAVYANRSAVQWNGVHPPQVAMSTQHTVPDDGRFARPMEMGSYH